MGGFEGFGGFFGGVSRVLGDFLGVLRGFWGIFWGFLKVLRSCEEVSIVLKKS